MFLCLTRSRRDFPAFNYGFFRPNPELYWEAMGNLRHSSTILSDLGLPASRALGWPGALTAKTADDNFAALCRKTRQSSNRG
jgi:hypothetical protein